MDVNWINLKMKYLKMKGKLFQPIVVLAQNPSECSMFVQSLISLIWPLRYLDINMLLHFLDIHVQNYLSNLIWALSGIPMIIDLSLQSMMLNFGNILQELIYGAHFSC